MIVRYRHFAALCRRGWNAVGEGRLDEAAWEAQIGNAFDIIATELRRSFSHRCDSFVRLMAARAWSFPFLPFHPATPLGPRGVQAYGQFRRWLEWKLKKTA